MVNQKLTNSHLVAELSLLLTVIFWSSAFVGIRVGLQGYHPGSLALLRYCIGSLCLIVVYWRIPNKTAIRWTDIPLIALIGIIGIGIYNISLNYAELQINAAVANFIVSQSPILTTLLAIFFLKEQESKLIWIGIGISFLGVCLIAVPGIHSLSYSRGLILLIIATLCSCLYTVLQKPLLSRIHPIQFACLAIWFGTAILFIYSLQAWHDMHTASLRSTLSVIYLGIFPACIAYALWSYVLSKLSTSFCSTAMYISPIVTLFMGWLFLHEVPYTLAIIGGVISLFGSYIVNRYRTK